MTTDFAGLNGFVWFTGIVENRQDPLKLGRVKVRIIGWHDFDENLVPTDSLPWAQILHSAVGPRTFTSIKEGEWVTGYFLDGNNAQEPVIMGVYPGIISAQTKKIIAKNAQAPQLPAGLRADVIGEPSIPPTARGKVEGTGIDVSNNSQAHVCDITTELQKDVALARAAFSQIMDVIRNAIRAFIASLGLDPSGEISKVVSLAKALLRQLNYIKGVLEELVDLKNILIDYARKVRAMIEYVLSLPEKLLNLLKDCLSNFLGAISSALGDLISIPGLDGLSSSTDFAELVDTLSEIGKTTQTIIKDSIDIATVPAQLIVAVATPASAADVKSIANTVSAYISTTSNTASIVATTYSSANTNLP